jgi:hypothetical protein
MPLNKTVGWDYTMVCAGKHLYVVNEKGGGQEAIAKILNTKKLDFRGLEDLGSL